MPKVSMIFSLGLTMTAQLALADAPYSYEPTAPGVRHSAKLRLQTNPLSSAAPNLRSEVRIHNSKCEFVATDVVGLDDDVTFWPVLTDESGTPVYDGRHIVWEVSYTAGPPWFKEGRTSDGLALGQMATFGISTSEYELGRTFTIITADKTTGIISAPVELHVERDTVHLCK